MRPFGVHTLGALMGSWWGLRGGAGVPIVFAFLGRASYRPAYGRHLYVREPAFRASIDACDLIARAHGLALSPLFADHPSEDPDPVRRERAHFAQVGVQQIALCDLLASLGIRPQATVAVSLGEVAAAYAAGVLSREDATHVLCAIAIDNVTEARPGEFLTIESGARAARDLCRDAPRRLTFIGSMSPVSAVLFSHAADLDQNLTHLASAGVVPARSSSTHPWHTPTRVQPVPEFHQRLRGLRTSEADCACFWSTAGADVSGGLVADSRYWEWVHSRPVFLGDALTELLSSGAMTIVDISARPRFGGLVSATAASLGVPKPKTIKLAPDADVGYDEVAAFHAGVGQLHRRRQWSRASKTPVWPQTDLADLEGQTFARDPIGRLMALRDREGPIVEVASAGCTYVLGHAEARAVLEDPSRFSSSIIPADVLGAVGLDPPEHTAARRDLLERFAPARQAGYRLVAREAAVRAVERAATLDEFDVLADLAVPVQESVAARIVGLDPEQGEALRSHIGSTGRTAADLVAATVSGLKSVVGATRSEQVLLWVASTATTKWSVAAAILALSRDASLRERVLARPELLPALFDEVARTSPPERSVARVVQVDTEIGDRVLKTGTQLQVSLLAANHDPLVHEEPRRFMLGRSTAHLALGAGPHRCPGGGVARMIFETVIDEMNRRLPRWQVLQPESSLRWFAGTGTSGFEELLVASGETTPGDDRT